MHFISSFEMVKIKMGNTKVIFAKDSHASGSQNVWYRGDSAFVLLVCSCWSFACLLDGHCSIINSADHEHGLGLGTDPITFQFAGRRRWDY